MAGRIDRVLVQRDREVHQEIRQLLRERRSLRPGAAVRCRRPMCRAAVAGERHRVDGGRMTARTSVVPHSTTSLAAVVTLEPADGMCVAPGAGTRAARRALHREGDQMDDQRTKGSTDGLGRRPGDAGRRAGQRQRSAAALGRADGPRRSARPGPAARRRRGCTTPSRGRARRGGCDRPVRPGDGPVHARGGERAGSEPLTEEGEQHRSGYGGAGGRPVTSSDEREASAQAVGAVGRGRGAPRLLARLVI